MKLLFPNKLIHKSVSNNTLKKASMLIVIMFTKVKNCSIMRKGEL